MDDVVVVERQAGSAQPERVGGQIDFAAEDARFQLDGSIAAIAKALQEEMAKA